MPTQTPTTPASPKLDVAGMAMPGVAATGRAREHPDRPIADASASPLDRRPRPPLQELRPARAARAELRVRRVLRAARGRLRLRRDPRPARPGDDRAAPAGHLALPRAAPRRASRRRAAWRSARLPLIAADRLGASLGDRPAVAQGRHPQPDPLVQGPGRGGGHRPGGRVRCRHPRLRVDRQPRRGDGGRRGGGRPARPSSSSRPTSSRPRSTTPWPTAPRSSRSTARTTRSTACRWRSPTSSAGRSSTSPSGRSTRRAARRSRSRSPSGSAGGCPTRSSPRSPRARSSRRSPRASTSWSTVGLVEPKTGQVHRRPAGRAARPVATAFRGGGDVIRPVEHPTTIVRSLAIGSPADGRYALELARRTGGSIEAVPDEATAAAIRSVAALEGIFPETAGGVTIAAAGQARAAGVIGPDDEVVALLTGNGLKTPDARLVRARRA